MLNTQLLFSFLNKNFKPLEFTSLLQFAVFLDMPFIEDWITHPMTIINRLHGENASLAGDPRWTRAFASSEKSPTTFEDDVRKYFQSNIDNPECYREIPCLNDRDDDHPLPSGCLVRYRAMIQDMADDEIYCSESSTNPCCDALLFV